MKKRYFSPCCLCGMVAFLLLLLSPVWAFAETRSLKIYYIHTKEKAEIAYKKDGRYLEAGLKKLNYMLRDWRRNEPTNMDPRLFDLIWQVYRLSGSRDYIHVVSAYRSPATNNMLRSRSASSGVAKNSQHTLGKALDFYLPDVNLAKLRALGLKQESGGVGYYPTSGSPFIHMDVGSVRHWPRMNRKELMALFPDGKTIHVPSDGKPLDGYNQALAAYNARKGALPPIVVAKESSRENREKKSLLAGLFGKKRDKDKPAETTTKLASREMPPAAVAEPRQEERVILPENDAPIPAFSPLKPSVGKNTPAEDEIGALLVAEATLATSSQGAIVEPSPPQPTTLAELDFIPVPVLKTHLRASPPPPTLPPHEVPAAKTGQDAPALTQTAYVATLSRPQQTASVPQPIQMLPPLSEEGEQQTLETVIASAQDIIPLPNDAFHHRADGTLDSGKDDFATIDRETIRTIIAEAMLLAEADSQMVASITPRTTPKADKPRPDELGTLIAQDEAKRLREAAQKSEKIHQIPELVFVSGLQKSKKQPVIATLDGKAINFPPVARINIHD